MFLVASAAGKSVVGASFAREAGKTNLKGHAGLSVLRRPASDRCELRGSKARRFGRHSSKARWAIRPAAASGRVC